MCLIPPISIGPNRVMKHEAQRVTASEQHSAARSAPRRPTSASRYSDTHLRPNTADGRGQPGVSVCGYISPEYRWPRGWAVRLHQAGFSAPALSPPSPSRPLLVSERKHLCWSKHLSLRGTNTAMLFGDSSSLLLPARPVTGSSARFPRLVQFALNSGFFVLAVL